MWVEEHLRGIGVDPNAVIGRATTVASTHRAAADAVAAGDADATIAIRAVAEALDLDFHLLFHERYDLIVAADRINEPAIARVVDELTKAGFKRKIGALPGYDASDTGREELVTT